MFYISPLEGQLDLLYSSTCASPFNISDLSILITYKLMFDLQVSDEI